MSIFKCSKIDSNFQHLQELHEMLAGEGWNGIRTIAKFTNSEWICAKRFLCQKNKYQEGNFIASHFYPIFPDDKCMNFVFKFKLEVAVSAILCLYFWFAFYRENIQLTREEQKKDCIYSGLAFCQQAGFTFVLISFSLFFFFIWN